MTARNGIRWNVQPPPVLILGGILSWERRPVRLCEKERSQDDHLETVHPGDGCVLQGLRLKRVMRDPDPPLGVPNVRWPGHIDAALDSDRLGGYFGSVVIGVAPVGQAFCDEIESEGYAKDATKATRVPRD